jgi:protein SCO1
MATFEKSDEKPVNSVVEDPAQQASADQQATGDVTVEATPIAPRHTTRPLWLLAIPMVLALVLSAVVWWMWPQPMHGVALQSPRETTDFTLQTSAGTPMSLSDFRGQYVLLYFGYTFCPDVCPITLNDLRNMAHAIGDRRMDNVQVIFISVDPERDTAEHLASYLPHFHPNFLGMTGTLEEIELVALQFGIYFESQQQDNETGYLVGHTSAVTLIDPEGHVRAIFPYGITGEEMAADLQYLMRRSFRF